MGTELIFTSLPQEREVQRPPLLTTLLQAAKNKIPFSPPTTPLTQFLCPPHPPRRLRVLQNPFKKQGS